MAARQFVLCVLVTLTFPLNAPAQVAIRGETVYTLAGPPIRDGVVLIGADGKIEGVGPAASVQAPSAYRTLHARVVTPGLIDAHTVVGLAGALNQPHDQMQLERSAPLQPELRAVDAYDARETLVVWLRGHGVTTIHTGHAPGALISGQTMVAKTRGEEVEDAVLEPIAMIAATLGDAGLAQGDRSPGTRATTSRSRTVQRTSGRLATCVSRRLAVSLPKSVRSS
jgi:imidazolonepropionase-like amidohydrolase